MGKRRTDFRELKARRDAALQRPELRQEHCRPTAEHLRLVEAAAKAGRVTCCAPARRQRR